MHVKDASVPIAPLFFCQMPLTVAMLCAMTFPTESAPPVAPRVWLDLTPGTAPLNLNDAHTRDRIARDCASGRPASPGDCAQLEALRRREALQPAAAPDRGSVAPPAGARWPSDTGFPPAGGQRDAMPYPCAPANPCPR
ncbi:hypothetical protein C7418_5408 [Cupriavidus plantarum]|nr:hypothetical protein C7418_5408 [Cupriavidus plantarum]